MTIKTALNGSASHALFGRMSPSERAAGRFLRNPDGHQPAPAPAGDPPAGDPTPPVENTDPAPTPPVEPPAGDPPSDDAPKPSDAEAKLLKEVMKHKEAARQAQERAKVFEGIDPEKARAALAAQAEAERKELEARGEYDRILAQVREQKDAEIAAAKEAAEALRQQLEGIQRTIEESNVRSSFVNSAFVRESLVISGEKVRALYGDHFDTVDGELVGYDKPRGAANRTILVGSDGQPLAFEAALEKVVKADSEWERLAKSKLKPGAGSNTSSINPQVTEKPQSGTDKIRAGLASLSKPSLNLSSVNTRR